VIGAVPSILPINTVLIDEESQHFKDSDCCMCLMKVYGILFLEFLKLCFYLILLLESSKNVLECRCYIEVYLFKSYFFILLVPVVRIKDRSDVLCILTLLD
jgi:hypothetical protein